MDDIKQFEQSIKAYRYHDAMRLLRKPRNRKDLEFSQRAFEIAVEGNATGVIKQLLKYHPLKSYSPMANASVELYSLLRYMELNDVPGEEAFEFYYEALSSSTAEAKLRCFQKEGLNLSVKNDKAQSLAEALKQRMENQKYPKSKKGDFEKKKDERIIAELGRMEKAGTIGGTAKKKKMIRWIVIAVLLFLIGIITYSITYERFRNTDGLFYETDTQAQAGVETGVGTTETEETETETTETETTEADATEAAE